MWEGLHESVRAPLWGAVQPVVWRRSWLATHAKWFFCTVIHAEYRDFGLVTHIAQLWALTASEREREVDEHQGRLSERARVGASLYDTSAGRCNSDAFCESVFDPHCRLFIDLDKGLTLWWRSQCPYLVKSGQQKVQREVLAAAHSFYQTCLAWVNELPVRYAAITNFIFQLSFFNLLQTLILLPYFALVSPIVCLLWNVLLFKISENCIESGTSCKHLMTCATFCLLFILIFVHIYSMTNGGGFC